VLAPRAARSTVGDVRLQGRYPVKSPLITEEAPRSIQEARPEGVHAQHKDPQFQRSSHDHRSRASEVEHPAGVSPRSKVAG